MIMAVAMAGMSRSWKFGTSLVIRYWSQTNINGSYGKHPRRHDSLRSPKRSSFSYQRTDIWTRDNRSSSERPTGRDHPWPPSVRLDRDMSVRFKGESNLMDIESIEYGCRGADRTPWDHLPPDGTRVLILVLNSSREREKFDMTDQRDAYIEINLTQGRW